jgi:hypothetical protein
MGSDKQKYLAKWKRIELEALGIDPVLFHLVCTYINKKYVHITKGTGTYFIFKVGDIKSGPVENRELVSDIKNFFGIKPRMARKMLVEWERERIIYQKLSDEATLHWDYMTVPLLYGQEDE